MFFPYLRAFDCQEEEGEEELPETEADAWTLRMMGCKLHGMSIECPALEYIHIDWGYPPPTNSEIIICSFL